VLVVGFDVAADLLAQVLDAGEGAAVDGSALELGEPGFDGVEPRGAGRREVEVEPRMSVEKALDLLGLALQEPEWATPAG
jgi:hypothetical protein